MLYFLKNCISNKGLFYGKFSVLADDVFEKNYGAKRRRFESAQRTILTFFSLHLIILR